VVVEQVCRGEEVQVVMVLEDEKTVDGKDLEQKLLCPLVEDFV